MPRSQDMLGFAYSNGLGVGQDYAQAAAWYRKAAEAAQNDLGLMYRNGKGVPQSL